VVKLSGGLSAGPVVEALPTDNTRVGLLDHARRDLPQPFWNFRTDLSSRAIPRPEIVWLFSGSIRTRPCCAVELREFCCNLSPFKMFFFLPTHPLPAAPDSHSVSGSFRTASAAKTRASPDAPGNREASPPPSRHRAPVFFSLKLRNEEQRGKRRGRRSKENGGPRSIMTPLGQHLVCISALRPRWC